MTGTNNLADRDTIPVATLPKLVGEANINQVIRQVENANCDKYRELELE